MSTDNENKNTHDSQKFDKCIELYLWAAANAAPEEGYFNCQLINVNEVKRHPGFRKFESQELSELWKMLEDISVVTESFSCETGGRPVERRAIELQWLATDPADLKVKQMLVLELLKRDVLHPIKSSGDSPTLKSVDTKETTIEPAQPPQPVQDVGIDLPKELSGDALKDVQATLRAYGYKCEKIEPIQVPIIDETAKTQFQKWTTGRLHRPLRVLANCFITMGSSFLKLAAGQTIDDYHLCLAAIDQKAPVAYLDEPDSASCPNCHNFFKVPEKEADRELPVLVVLTDFHFWQNGSQIKLTTGQIIGAPEQYHLIKLLLDSAYPVAVAKPDEYGICPKCQHVFSRTKLLGNNQLPHTLNLLK